jgi:hypothetical protein
MTAAAIPVMLAIAAALGFAAGIFFVQAFGERKR